MKLPPRTNAHRLALASLLALACTNSTCMTLAARTQRQPAKSKGDAKPQRKSNTKSSERRVREQAVAALFEAAEAARVSDDLFESIRLRASVAEVLWPHDARSARAMLRRAWEDANPPGAGVRQGGLGLDDDDADSDAYVARGARRFVVKVAFKHDPPLAEEFMRQLAREADASAEAAGETVEPAPLSSEANVGRTAGPRSLSPAGMYRLLLARELLQEGDAPRAAAAAAPLVMEGPTMPLLDFLAALRAQAPREADALYLRLLERTRADASADANDVLLLSGPIVSPTLRARVSEDGSVGFNSVARAGDVEGDAAAASALPPQVRGAFFDLAAALLLRPRAGTRPVGESVQIYFTTKRLLPFFEREAPRHAAALHAMLASLTTELAGGSRDLLDSQAGLTSMTPKNPVDSLAPLHKWVADAGDEAERDRRRFELVAAAARRRLWERARATAEEIADEETRRHARRLVAMQQVLEMRSAFEEGAPGKRGGKDGEDGEAERVDHVGRAAEFVRGADVPPEVRAAGLAQVAEIAARHGEETRAAEFVNEAAAFAQQSEREGGHRTLALAFVTLAAARLADPRAWETLPTLVRSADEDRGEEINHSALSFEYVFEHLGQSVTFSPQRDTFDLREVFAAAARLDLARTLAEARALKDEAARANMLFAAARAALAHEEKRPDKRDAKSAP